MPETIPGTNMPPKPHHLPAAASMAALLLAASAPHSVSSQTFTLAASGDFIGDLVPNTTDPRVHAVWDLVRSADFGFFNMEGSLFSSSSSSSSNSTTNIYPASENGKSNTYGDVGGGPSYDPVQAALLSAAGFNIASHANNHAFDYAEAGMFATQRALAAADITFAGSGASLQEARRHVVRESRRGGGEAGGGGGANSSTRLALVAAAGTHTLQSVAGAGSDEFHPRPGISALRAGIVTVVDAAGFAAIKAVARAQGQALSDDDNSTADIVLYTGQYQYAWSTWRLATDSTPVGLAWEVNEDDYVGILDSFRAARDEADAVVFSLHAHESFAGVNDSANPLPLAATVPAAYTQNVSRTAVDAGADVVLVHGPHHLRGVEVYGGKPIFYGLGSLTYSLGLHYGGYDLPIEWDDGVVAVTRFEEGVLVGVELHPLVHGQLANDTESSGESALPKVAPPAEAGRILEYLGRVSEPFGTGIEVRDGVGYVELGL